MLGYDDLQTILALREDRRSALAVFMSNHQDRIADIVVAINEAGNQANDWNDFIEALSPPEQESPEGTVNVLAINIFLSIITNPNDANQQEVFDRFIAAIIHGGNRIDIYLGSVVALLQSQNNDLANNYLPKIIRAITAQPEALQGFLNAIIALPPRYLANPNNIDVLRRFIAAIVEHRPSLVAIMESNDLITTLISIFRTVNEWSLFISALHNAGILRIDNNIRRIFEAIGRANFPPKEAQALRRDFMIALGASRERGFIGDIDTLFQAKNIPSADIEEALIAAERENQTLTRNFRTLRERANAIPNAEARKRMQDTLVHAFGIANCANPEKLAQSFGVLNQSGELSICAGSLLEASDPNVASLTRTALHNVLQAPDTFARRVRHSPQSFGRMLKHKYRMADIGTWEELIDFVHCDVCGKYTLRFLTDTSFMKHLEKARGKPSPDQLLLVLQAILENLQFVASSLRDEASAKRLDRAINRFMNFGFKGRTHPFGINFWGSLSGEFPCLRSTLTNEYVYPYDFRQMVRNSRAKALELLTTHFAPPPQPSSSYVAGLAPVLAQTPPRNPQVVQESRKLLQENKQTAAKAEKTLTRHRRWHNNHGATAFIPCSTTGRPLEPQKVESQPSPVPAVGSTP